MAMDSPVSPPEPCRGRRCCAVVDHVEVLLVVIILASLLLRFHDVYIFFGSKKLLDDVFVFFPCRHCVSSYHHWLRPHQSAVILPVDILQNCVKIFRHWKFSVERSGGHWNGKASNEKVSQKINKYT